MPMTMEITARHIICVALSMTMVAVVIWGGIALVEGWDEGAPTSGAPPVNDRIQLLVYLNNQGEVEGYELVKDDLTLLMLWDYDADGVLDMWEYYIDGESDVLVKDRNGDRRIDWWQVRTGIEAAELVRDDDYDGVVDKESKIRFVTKH